MIKSQLSTSRSLSVFDFRLFMNEVDEFVSSVTNILYMLTSFTCTLVEVI